MTEAEYLALDEASAFKHEFVDGEVYAMTGGSEKHSIIGANTLTALHIGLRSRPCIVYTADMRVHVATTGNYFYPDITVVCGERRFMTDAPIATLLNPALIVEVLSPSTELYDRTTKFQHYQQIPELESYILVAQDRPYIEHYMRGEDTTWIYRQAAGLDGTLHLSTLEVTLALSEIYAQIDFDNGDLDGPAQTHETD